MCRLDEKGELKDVFWGVGSYEPHMSLVVLLLVSESQPWVRESPGRLC